MQIIVVRHGFAEERDEFSKTGQEDHLRPLIPKGRKQTEKVARKIRDWIEGVDLIVTSPYVRAQQTAEILSYVYTKAKVIESIK